MGGGDRDTGLQWLLAHGGAGSTTSSALSCVLKPHGCGTWGHRLGVALAVLEMMILVGFSSFKDSMVPKLEHRTHAQKCHIPHCSTIPPSCLFLEALDMPALLRLLSMGHRGKLRSLSHTENWEHWELGQTLLSAGHGLPALQLPQPHCSREESQA